MALQRSYVGGLVKPGFNSLVFEWVAGSAPKPKPVAGVAVEKPAPRTKSAKKSAPAKPRSRR